MRFGCIALLAWLPVFLFAQNPWSRNKAGFYAQTAYHFIPAYSALFGPDGEDILLNHTVSEQQIQLYAEYGLSNKSTLVFTLPAVFNGRSASKNAPETSAHIAGVGNVSIALRHQFLSGKMALGGTLKIGFPALRAYEPSTDLRTGYNALTLEPMLSLGKGFRKAYAYIYGGYGYRTDRYSHFLHCGAEAGVHIWRIWITGFSDVVLSMENGGRSPVNDPGLTGLYGNDQGWVSVGAKLILELNRFVGINLSGAGAAWAQYVPKSPGIGAGIYFKWD